MSSGASAKNSSRDFSPKKSLSSRIARGLPLLGEVFPGVDLQPFNLFLPFFPRDVYGTETRSHLVRRLVPPRPKSKLISPPFVAGGRGFLLLVRAEPLPPFLLPSFLSLSRSPPLPSQQGKAHIRIPYLLPKLTLPFVVLQTQLPRLQGTHGR